MEAVGAHGHSGLWRGGQLSVGSSHLPRLLWRLAFGKRLETRAGGSRVPDPFLFLAGQKLQKGRLAWDRSSLVSLFCCPSPVPLPTCRSAGAKEVKNTKASEVGDSSGPCEHQAGVFKGSGRSGKPHGGKKTFFFFFLKGHLQLRKSRRE